MASAKGWSCRHITNTKGEWYMVHLCGRPIKASRVCTLGRETCIQKVIWTKAGWIKNENSLNDSLNQRVAASNITVVSAEIPEVRQDEKPCYYTGAGMQKGFYIRVGDTGDLGERFLDNKKIGVREYLL